MLAIVVAALGPALMLIPLNALRLFVGGLLLIFGLAWLRKAILRASGYKALHDEDAIYARQMTAATAAGHTRRAVVDDWYAFTLSFKGVVLEGLEVAFIVLTFGSNQGSIPLGRAGRGSGGRRGHRGRDRGPCPARAGAGEHPQVRRRGPPHIVRHLLGGRGRGGALAGR